MDHGAETKWLDNISASTARHSKSPEDPEDAILDLILNGTLGLDPIQFKHPYRNGKVKKKKSITIMSK